MPTTALDAALCALRDGHGGPAAIRAASRAADDAELAALEASTRERAEMLSMVREAREEIVTFRQSLRRKASENREELLKGGGGGATDDTNQVGAAEAVARDINNSLRRSTGVVTQEVARSNAAAHVVDASGRTLRKTRDTHRTYGDGLKDGRDVLAELSRAERRANTWLAVSLAFFVVVVSVVAARRLQRSRTLAVASLFVRPTWRFAMMPVMAGKKVSFAVKSLLRKRDGSKFASLKRNKTLAATVTRSNTIASKVRLERNGPPRFDTLGVCGLAELRQCSRTDWVHGLLAL